MKKLGRLAVGIVMVVFTSSTLAQSIPRILLVGDSWPALMWQQRSLKKALADEGLGTFEERGSVTAVSGSTAAQWATPPYLQLITSELKRYPAIDIVHLSIGGNDFLFFASPDDTTADRARLINSIVQNTKTVADHILKQRPNLRVLLVEYDYPSKAFDGFTAESLNAYFIESARARLDLSKSTDRLFYLSNLGLMQSTYGCPPHFGPGEVPLPGDAPDCQPLSGGNPLYCSPTSAFMDAIHLDSEGYLVLSKRCINQLYRQWLLHPLDETGMEDWEVF